MKFVYNDISGKLESAFTDFQKPIAKALSASMLEVAQTAVRDGRSEIAAAGFSDRYFKWQSGFNYRVFPGEGRPSLRPAARVEHSVGIASVFEHGTPIIGKPLLWLPLDKNLPRGFRGGPKQFLGKLASVKRPGKRPLLVGRPFGRPQDKAVPLFVGIDRAQMPKKFNLYRTIQRAADRLAEFYINNLKPEDR